MHPVTIMNAFRNTRSYQPRAIQNGLNSLCSTGPRALAGKARSSQNALKHRLTRHRHRIPARPGTRRHRLGPRPGPRRRHHGTPDAQRTSLGLASFFHSSSSRNITAPLAAKATPATPNRAYSAKAPGTPHPRQFCRMLGPAYRRRSQNLKISPSPILASRYVSLLKSYRAVSRHLRVIFRARVWHSLSDPVHYSAGACSSSLAPNVIDVTCC